MSVGVPSVGTPLAQHSSVGVTVGTFQIPLWAPAQEGQGAILSGNFSYNDLKPHIDPLLTPSGSSTDYNQQVINTDLNDLLRESPILDNTKVYNMLITTLFLFFLLTSVSLFIFLMMRKPTCVCCCKDPFDVSPTHRLEAPPDVLQQNISTYLTETQGVVVKKCLTDSPPPYESPPDYHSLPPEVLVSARGLTGLESASQDSIPALHNVDRTALKNASKPRAPPRNQKLRVLASRSSNFLSSAAPLLPSAKPSPHSSSSPQSSPSLCSSGGILSFSSCKPSTTADGVQEYTPPPPPYEIVVNQLQNSQESGLKEEGVTKGS